MRKDRQPKRGGNGKPHTLISAIPGKNRFHPGIYQCKCGEFFSGINRYEKHKAEERRRLTELAEKRHADSVS